MSEAEVRDRYPAVYQRLLATVKPYRDNNNRASYRNLWWIYGEPRSELRRALAGLDRYIVTIETTKHRVFQFLPSSVVPDNKLIAIAAADALVLAILSSRVHAVWALHSGGRLGVGDDPVYVKSRCFDPFPFPADVPAALRAEIAAEAEALDALRKRVLAADPGLTLTKVYNVVDALRAGRLLTAPERALHDRALASLIAGHHDRIDALVARAYGWTEMRPDDADILTRLVALNRVRAQEEARGHVRYLRPAFQDPGYHAPVDGRLDLGEVAIVLPDHVVAWPATLSEQVGVVRTILAAAHAPLGAQDIARGFRGKRAASVRPVLDALAGLGMARRLGDGRYAA